MAETVLMNILRGDVARLGRCTNAITGDENELPRVKPLKFCFEKDIVFYARLQNLEYFYTECIYAPNSYRNFARNYIKQLERLQPRAILDLIHSGETVAIRKEASTQIQTNCTRCGYMSSQPVCKACLLLEGLNTGNYQIGNSSKKKPREPTETSSVTGENPAPEKSTSGCGGQCACEAKGLSGLSI
ncbi:hypothetical protein WR25_17034 [Diploscapter pachys]|uniref:Cytoplasmic tRNA 2-thiolation protein 1 C-terminal domain-containing protein n=1 Tax=Diploscapter pachys TaxID=2018661 RepID=A0A2A2KZE7_9BILA|nr:hypothetical protein WR25_17034 [Diploscapter pachys]